MADSGDTHSSPTNQRPLECAEHSNFESSRIQAVTSQQTVHPRKTKKKIPFIVYVSSHAMHIVFVCETRCQVTQLLYAISGLSGVTHCLLMLPKIIKKYYHCRVKEKRNSWLHGLFPVISSEEHFSKLFYYYKRTFPWEQPCWIGLKFCRRQPVRLSVRSGAAKFLQVCRTMRLTEATHNRQACLPPSVSHKHNRATPYSFLKTTKWISEIMQQAFSSYYCKY